MKKWCIKPENEKQAFIIGKWFDENNGSSKDDKFYQEKPKTNMFYVYGCGPGNVWFFNTGGRKLTFQEFENEILGKNVEPVYDIY